MSESSTTVPQHHHPLTTGLLIGFVPVFISLFVFIAGGFNQMNHRMDDILAIDGVSRGVGKAGSPSVVLTDFGKSILKNENDFRKALFEIYKGKPKTKPERAYRDVIDIIGVERHDAILTNYKLNCRELITVVLSFYGGVKHKDYLTSPPDFLK